MKHPRLRLAQAAIAATIVLVAGVWFWWRQINLDPIVQIPLQKLPSPNAYDFYMTAVQTGAKEQVGMTMAQKEALSAKNAACLALVREAFKYECVRPRDSMLLSGRFRELARRLRLEAEVLAHRGDWEAAAKTHIDIVRLSEDTSKGVFTDMMSGGACQSIGRSGFWKVIPRLSSSTARECAARLETIVANRWSFRENCQQDKWLDLELTMESMRSPEWRSLSDPDPPPEASRLEHAVSVGLNSLLRYTANKRRLLRDTVTYHDGWILRASSGYAVKTRTPQLPNHPLLQASLSPPEVIQSIWCIRETMNVYESQLLAALALQAYRRDHQRYPRSLDELVPTYLQSIPDDPFAPGGSLRYRRFGEQRYLLYSIGPDGKDHGGRPTRNPPYSSGVGRVKSKGDLVWGINR